MLLAASPADFLDDLIEYRPTQRTRSLFVALLLVLVLHLLVITFLKISPATQIVHPDLIVTLNREIKAKPEVTPRAQPEKVLAATNRQLEPAAITPELDLPEDRLVDPETEDAGPRGLVIFQNARAFIRAQVRESLELETAPKRSTFSTRDFPGQSSETSGQDETGSSSPILVSRPTRIEARNAQGYYTIKTTDGFGHTVCFQERGFAGDGNPPLWYRIPASTCGHL